MHKMVLLVATLALLSGCAATVFNPFSTGQFALMGDREGIEAYEDSQLGLVSEGDNTDGESNYFNLREKETPTFKVASKKKGVK